jgi:hypothetical protein
VWFAREKKKFRNCEPSGALRVLCVKVFSILVFPPPFSLKSERVNATGTAPWAHFGAVAVKR